MKFRFIIYFAFFFSSVIAHSEELNKEGDLAYEIVKAKSPGSYHLTVYAEEDNFFTPKGGNPQPKLCIFTDLNAEMSMRLETRKSKERWYCSLLVEVQDFKKESYVVHVVYEKSVSMLKINNSSFKKQT